MLLLSVAIHSGLFSMFLLFLLAKSFPTLLQPHGLLPTRLFCLWEFPNKNTGVRSHFLLQGIFLTQGSHLCPVLIGRLFTTKNPLV